MGDNPKKRGGDSHELQRSVSWKRILNAAIEEPESGDLVHTRRFIVTIFTRALREGIIETSTVKEVFPGAIIKKLFADTDAVVRWSTGMLICEWGNFEDDGRYVVQVANLLQTFPPGECAPYQLNCGDDSSFSEFEGELSRMLRRLFYDKRRSDDVTSREQKKKVTVELKEALLEYVKEGKATAKDLIDKADDDDEDDDDNNELHTLWIGFEALKAFAYLPFDVLYDVENEQQSDLLIKLIDEC